MDARVLNYVATLTPKPPTPPVDTTPNSIVLDQHTMALVVGLPTGLLTPTVFNVGLHAIPAAPVTYVSSVPGVATVGSTTGIVTAVADHVVLASDPFTRGDNASSLGTAPTGGAWTNQVGALGINGNRAGNASGTAGALSTLTLASQADAIAFDVTTPALQTYGLAPVLRYVDASNLCRLAYVSGAGFLKLVTIVGGSTVVVFTSATAVLPTTGAFTGTLGATISATGLVTILLNGASVGTYQLTAPELAAFGASLKVGITQVGTGTLSFGDNFAASVAGTTTITASTANGKTDTCVVSVSADTTPATIVLSPLAITMLTTDADVNATTTVQNVSGLTLPISVAPVAFSSDTPAVFTVNASTGVVHPVGAGSGVLRAQTSVPGVFDTSPVTVNVPASGSRTMRIPLAARTRVIFKAPSRNNAIDVAFANANFDDIENTGVNGNLAAHPNAISVQTYALLCTSEVDTGAVFSAGTWTAGRDDANASASYKDFAAAYATANGLNVENFFIHVRTGDQNMAAGITSITAAGVVNFNNPTSAGQVTTYALYHQGITSVTLSGLSVGNGVYTIASFQKNGVTLTGWTGGDLALGATPNTTKIGTLYVPGDGTLNNANRKWFFFFSEWRQFPTFSDVGCCAMQAARFVKIMQNTGAGGQAINAALVDEMDSSMYTNPNPQSVEYGTTGGTTFGASVTCPYSTDLAACITGIRSTLGAGYYLRVNTASRVFACDKQIAVAAGGIHGEQLETIFVSDTAFLDYYITLVNLGVDVEFVDGNTWLSAANNGGVTPVPGIFATSGSYNAGNYPSANHRRQMSSFANYLMGMDATRTLPDGTKQRHAIFDLTNSAAGDSPISSRFTPAAQYPIGDPTGAYAKSALIAPPTGSNVRVLSRAFSLDGGTTASAYAVLVLSSGSPPSTNYDDTSVVNVTLPAPPATKAWYQLNQDGTIGTSPVTSLNVRRAEGVIFIAAPAGVQAQRAETFVKSAGATVHTNADPANAHFPDIILPTIKDIGMRVVRSGTDNSTSDLLSSQVLWTEAGVQTLMVLNRGSTDTDTSIMDFTLAFVDPLSIRALEGPNEVDNNTIFGGNTSALHSRLAAFMGAHQSKVLANPDPNVRALPLTTPTIVSTLGASNLGDMSSFCTFGTMHPYPSGGQEPGSQLAAGLALAKPTFAALTQVVASETGYNTAPNQTGESYLIGQGISEVAQQKLLPRLFAEYFAQGVSLTTIYDYINDGNNPSLTDGESNFGLIRYDGTYKAVATTLKNLFAILSETVWTDSSGSVGSAYVDDTFVRANQTEWGTATSGGDTGKTWVPDGAARHSIVSNAGVVTPTFQTNSVIGDAHTQDVEQYVEVRNARANYTNRVRVYSRWVDLTHNYSVDWIPTVTNPFSINKNSVASQLAVSSNTSYNALSNFNIRFWTRTVGTDVYLQARIWDSALAEPTTVDLFAIDRAPAAGYLSGKFAFWGDNNSSGQQMKLTRYKASPLTVVPGSRSALAPLTLTRLQYSYTGAPGTLRDLLLQKADGTFFLVLWNRVQCYNQSTKSDIVNAPVSMSISFPVTHTVSQYVPSAGQSSTFLATATSASFNLTDEVTILHIS